MKNLNSKIVSPVSSLSKGRGWNLSTRNIKKVIMIFGLIISIIITLAYMVNAGIKHEERMKAITKEYSIKIEQALTRVSQMVRLVEVLNQTAPDVLLERDFYELSETLATNMDYIIITYAPNGINKFVYPKAFASIKGLDLFTHPQLKDIKLKLKEAGKKRDRIVLRGPESIILLDGKPGLVVSNPIFLGEDRVFWGFSNAMIDLEGFIKTKKIEDISKLGFEYQLSYETKEDNNKIVITKSKGYDGIHCISREFPFENSTMKIKLGMDHFKYYSVSFAILIFVFIIMLFYTIAVCITNKIEKRKRVERELYKDTLTNIFNRRKIEMVAKEHIENKVPFLLVFIDLDDFKSINDNFGYEIGDKLLVSFVKRVKNNISKDTIFSRVAGNEFFLLFNGDYNDDGVEAIKNRLKKLSNNPYQVDDLNIQISTNIGFSHFPKDSSNIKELFAIADERMYKDKKSNSINLDLLYSI